MIPCICPPGFCAREEGAIPVKSRMFFCLGRPVVARHEPTIPDWYGFPGKYQARGYEPISEEL